MLDTIRSSLRLLRVEQLTLSVFTKGAAFGDPKRKVQGHFRYGASEYRLWVTDPDYEQEFSEKEDGKYGLGECFLTVSLSEPFNQACYKLIAAIIERAGGPLP